MKATAAKNNKISPSKPAGFEIPPSLQENLTSAIHGAFEVAVEIAVLEVTKLISAAAGDMYEKIRHENETLKEELQKAQTIIESVCRQAGSVSSQSSPHLRDNVASNTTTTPHNVFMSDQERQQTRSKDQLLPDERHKEEEAGLYFARQEDAVSGSREQINNWANETVEHEQNESHAFNKPNISGTNKQVPHEYGVKAERINQPCMVEEAGGPPAEPFANNVAPPLVKVKVEKTEEPLIVSDGLVDPFKEDAISQLQSEIMQDWTPGVSHFENEQQNVTLQTHSQVHGRTPNMNFSLDIALDSASTIDVNFPGNVTDQALTQDPSPLHTYGSPVRRNQANPKLSIHTCKLCGVNFPLPSLLRRHYGQCQQKHNQRIYVPTVGGKRTKLQLYPPGCSPFRCSECNREFNRLENLKTHLRIHTGERPYKCSVCSTAFRHSGALTRHFRIHTGEKPYVCGLCGKSFRNCGGLKFHQRSHNKQLQN